jgi:AcrR family transcriptional regulator
LALICTILSRCSAFFDDEVLTDRATMSSYASDNTHQYLASPSGRVLTVIKAFANYSGMPGTIRQDARAAQQQLGQRILDVFSVRAKTVGLRNVMMGELASELRISASTLYKHFPSKEALTLACVERWADEYAGAQAAKYNPRAKRDPFDQFMHWIDAWSDAHAELSPAFAQDLESDYPAAFRRFREIVRERKQAGAELLRPVLKSELDERVAFAVLDLILTTVLRPEFADRLRISRHDAIRSAVMIWAGGAVNRRGKLRALRDSKRRLK